MPKINFGFTEKEGKFFSPIARNEPNYIISNGSRIQSGQKVVGGVKGVYAQVRITLPTSQSGNEAELFSLNTEFFPSSN